MAKQSLAAAALAALILAFGTPAKAEFQISAYGGASTTFDSTVETNQGGVDRSWEVEWYGDNLDPPPYYGFRGTWWPDDMPNWGLAIDFTHAKAKADPPPQPYFSKLEFTHGLNLLTANLLYRLPTETRFTPYAGFGAGIAVPHVQITTPISRDSGYQVTGPAAQGLVGVNARLWGDLSVFGEYKLSYSRNSAHMKRGGTLDTNLWTNHFIFGVAYSFD